MSELWNDYLDGWKGIVDFSGKTDRKKFWVFWLFNLLVTAVLTYVLRLIGASGVMYAFDIIFFVAQLAIASRRLHDTGRSAWNLLWYLLPIIGWVILLVYYLQPSQK